jgi:hypothetical protein
MITVGHYYRNLMFSVKGGAYQSGVSRKLLLEY